MEEVWRQLKFKKLIFNNYLDILCAEITTRELDFYRIGQRLRFFCLIFFEINIKKSEQKKSVAVYDLFS
jgi:hypothetical protein